jgi:hypothetical protein
MVVMVAVSPSDDPGAGSGSTNPTSQGMGRVPGIPFLRWMVREFSDSVLVASCRDRGSGRERSQFSCRLLPNGGDGWWAFDLIEKRN